jgi:hypothetical protein
MRHLSSGESLHPSISTNTPVPQVPLALSPSKTCFRQSPM